MIRASKGAAVETAADGVGGRGPSGSLWHGLPAAAQLFCARDSPAGSRSAVCGLRLTWERPVEATRAICGAGGTAHNPHASTAAPSFTGRPLPRGLGRALSDERRSRGSSTVVHRASFGGAVPHARPCDSRAREVLAEAFADLSPRTRFEGWSSEVPVESRREAAVSRLDACDLCAPFRARVRRSGRRAVVYTPGGG